MQTPLATREELEARLEFPLDDERLVSMADAVLEDASTLVREYGVASWDAATAPGIAVMLTLKAAARHMNNPMFLQTARGADETNMWGDANANGVYLEPSEILLLERYKELSGGIYSANTYLHSGGLGGGRRGPNVPVDYGDGTAKWFPFDYRPGDVYSPYYPGGAW